MAETSTTATPTPSEIATALDRVAVLDRELRDDPAPEGATSRTTRIAEKLKLLPVAYASPPAAPPAGPALDVRLAAREETRRLTALLASLPLGHPDENDIRERLIALGGITNAAEIAKSSTVEPYDFAPAEVRGEAWMLELVSTARSLDLETAVAPLLYVAVGELHGGRLGWTDDEATADLVERHGQEKADAIIEDAMEAARHLPKSFRAWLDQKNLIANPRLVEAVASAWRRRGGREENKDGLRDFATALNARLEGGA